MLQVREFEREPVRALVSVLCAGGVLGQTGMVAGPGADEEAPFAPESAVWRVVMTRRVIKITAAEGPRDVQITERMWAALELISPDWEFLKWTAFRVQTRLALERRGWIEVRNVAGYMHIRLTREGCETRDAVYRRLALRKARSQGEHV